MLLAAPLLAAVPLSAASAPGKIRLYKDWAVGCDNLLACQAVALLPSTGPDGHLTLFMSRSAAPSAPVELNIDIAATKSDRYNLMIDGKTVDTGRIEKDSNRIKLSGPDAAKIIQLMANGKQLRLEDSNGALLGLASLAGSKAAMIHIDEMQGRLNQQNALFATGKRPDRPKVRKPVVIEAKKFAATNVLPDTISLVKLSESSDCAEERNVGPTADSAYSLGNVGGVAKALVLLYCGNGAYNSAVGAYVGRLADGKWTFSPALFDKSRSGKTDSGAVTMLVNASWDSGNQTVSSYSKGRGLGDCGTAQDFVWDGNMFRLVRISELDECRGSRHWITTWRAQVKFIS